MCHQCGFPGPCNCNIYTYPYRAPYGTPGCRCGGRCNGQCGNNNGCPVRLDFECVIYNIKNNNQPALNNLNLGNGATLKLFAETVNEWIGQLHVENWTLPLLRGLYGSQNVNTLTAFGQRVDQTLLALSGSVLGLSGNANTPVSATNTPAITLNLSGTLNHNIEPVLNLAASGGNQATILSDGLYVKPQLLFLDYTNKTLQIADGNTVDFSSFICGVGGFLGNVDEDPETLLDGQYWYRTDVAELDGFRIRLNGETYKVALTTP